MSGLILPRRFNQQPQNAAPVDTNNRITTGMIAGVIPHQRRDFVTGAGYTQEGAYATDTSTAGIGLTTNGSSSDIWVAIPQVVLTKFTLFGLFRSNGNAIDTRAIALGSSANNNPIVQIGAGATTASKVRVFSRDDAASALTSIDSTASAFDGTLHSVAIVYDAANFSCYIDGKFDSSLAAPALVFTVDRCCIGALYRSSAAAWWAGTTFIGAAWKRALSAIEIASISANPWQLFPAPARRLWAVSGTPATPTGTFTSTLDGAILAASGAVTNAGSFASTLAGCTMTASGSVGSAPSGAFASTLDGFTMAATGTINDKGAFASTLAGVSMAASGTVAPNVTGSFASTLEGVTMAASESVAQSGFRNRRRILRRDFIN